MFEQHKMIYNPLDFSNDIINEVNSGKTSEIVSSICQDVVSTSVKEILGEKVWYPNMQISKKPIGWLNAN